MVSCCRLLTQATKIKGERNSKEIEFKIQNTTVKVLMFRIRATSEIRNHIKPAPAV